MALCTFRYFRQIKSHHFFSLLKTQSYCTKEENNNKIPLKISNPNPQPLKKDPTVSKINENLVDAVNQVTNHLHSNDDGIKKYRTASQLLSRLKKIEKETNSVKSLGEVSGMASLFNSIKIEKPDKKQSEETQKFLESRRLKRKIMNTNSTERSRDQGITLLSGVSLNIFTNFKEGSENEEPVKCKTWHRCLLSDLKAITTPKPKNFLEEMIEMTDKGMLWHLPLNNEQGIVEEELEPYHKHVFLDHHIESWCPKTGPIRHFMELVISGLSNNPFISVKKKEDHIQWFKEYFSSKNTTEILKLTGIDATAK